MLRTHMVHWRRRGEEGKGGRKGIGD